MCCACGGISVGVVGAWWGRGGGVMGGVVGGRGDLEGVFREEALVIRNSRVEGPHDRTGHRGEQKIVNACKESGAALFTLMWSP